MKKIAIFASGHGTNFLALTQAIHKQHIPVEAALLVCDQPKAPVLKLAEAMHVPSLLVNFRHFEHKAAAEAYILKHLQALHVEGILLAGYMRIIGSTLLNAYPKKIINIHPALLPKFPGAHGIEDAFNAGVDTTGVTIHYIDNKIDNGPIIAQRKVPILPNDTLETLEPRIHDTEHQLYPEVLRELITKGVF